MHFKYATGMSIIVKAVFRFKFLILGGLPIIRTQYLREQGCYFAKSKGVREQNS
jgi:hypothetical protein